MAGVNHVPENPIPNMDVDYVSQYLGVGTNVYVFDIFFDSRRPIYLKGKIGFNNMDEGYSKTVALGYSIGMGFEILPHFNVEGLDIFVPRTTTGSGRKVETNSFQLLFRGLLF